MKFFSLAETAAGSGLFEMFGDVLEAPSTSAALSKVSRLVAPGRRVAVSPYRNLGGMPEPITPSEAEQKMVYDLLLAEEEGSITFISEKQILSSKTSDAAMTACALQFFYGRRTALTSHIMEKTEAAPVETSSLAPASSDISSVTPPSGGSGSATSNSQSGSEVPDNNVKDSQNPSRVKGA